MLGFYKNIALIGMRCTGKSGIGKELAILFNAKFIDIDKEIEKISGKTAVELTENGRNWIDFRKLETKILQESLELENVVISCGGGCGVNDLTFQEDITFGEIQVDIFLKNVKTCKILLYSDLENVISRFEKDKNSEINRPILSQNLTWRDDLILQYYKRKNIYQNIATFAIDTNNAENSFYNILYEIKAKILQKTNAVIGFPISHSMSPDIHNAWYGNLNIQNKYNFIALEIKTNNLHKIQEYIINYNLHGISVTSPHKENIMQYLDKIDESAKIIGAVNTIVRNEKNELIGYNTDCIGIKNALLEICTLEDQKIAILGTGGTAMSSCFALCNIAKEVTIFGRNLQKMQYISQKFNIKSYNIKDIKVEDFNIIINATSCGVRDDECPINTDKINKNHIIFDVIYSPLYTKLLKDANNNGAKIICGTQMLIHQAIKQFEFYTNHIPDIQIAQNIVDKKIQINDNISNAMDKIFISINAKNVNSLRNEINIARKLTKNIEIRVDLIQNLTIVDIKDIIEISQNMNVIFTCRKKEHGGEYIGTEYNEIMYLASQYFQYIDIDIQDINLTQTMQNSAKIISSYHNFNDTNIFEIEKIIQTMQNYNANIYKIAIQSNSQSDNLKCISLLEKYQNLAIINMSNVGKINRFNAIIYGSKLGFAGINNTKITAKGQGTWQEYLSFFTSLYNIL